MVNVWTCNCRYCYCPFHIHQASIVNLYLVQELINLKLVIEILQIFLRRLIIVLILIIPMLVAVSPFACRHQTTAYSFFKRHLRWRKLSVFSEILKPINKGLQTVLEPKLPFVKRKPRFIGVLLQQGFYLALFQIYFHFFKYGFSLISFIFLASALTYRFACLSK